MGLLIIGLMTCGILDSDDSEEGDALYVTGSIKARLGYIKVEESGPEIELTATNQKSENSYSFPYYEYTLIISDEEEEPYQSFIAAKTSESIKYYLPVSVEYEYDSVTQTFSNISASFKGTVDYGTGIVDTSVAIEIHGM